MKTVLIFAIFVSLSVSGILCSIDNQWKEFKIKYNKKYKSPNEEQRRFMAFKKNLKEINKHNLLYQRGLETFEKGVTIFADLTKKQFDKKYGLRIPSKYIKYDDSHKTHRTNLARDKNESTVYLDWREKGAVTPIKKQGLCGACWIFSAIGMLEGYNFIKTGKLISLSEQNIVDCFSNVSCEGGYPGLAVMYAKEHGVSREADYPYQSKQKKCKTDVPKIHIDFKELKLTNGTEEELKVDLEKYGPIGVSLYVSGNWRLYTKGVWYEKKCSDYSNHSLVLVGYGTENGVDYWLIKNSWGKQWGENGYIKIARNRHKNYCGLTNEAMYII